MHLLKGSPPANRRRGSMNVSTASRITAPTERPSRAAMRLSFSQLLRREQHLRAFAEHAHTIPCACRLRAVLHALRRRSTGALGSAVPMRSAVGGQTALCGTRRRARRRAGPEVGSAKIAVPTWTATAPTARKSSTSSRSRDAADGDDRDLDRLDRLVHDAQRDGLDRRAAQAAVDVAEQRPARGRVPRRSRTACCSRSARRRRHPRWPWRSAGCPPRSGDSLTSSGRSVAAPDGGGHLGGRTGVDRELEPARADVRARRC